MIAQMFILAPNKIHAKQKEWKRPLATTYVWSMIDHRLRMMIVGNVIVFIIVAIPFITFTFAVSVFVTIFIPLAGIK